MGLGVAQRAWKAIGAILATILVDSTGTALGTATNPLRNRRTGSAGVRVYSQQTGALALSTEVSAFTGATLGGLVAGKAVDIISLEISVDHDTEVRIKLQPRASQTAGGGTILLNTARGNGSSYDPMTVASIRQHGHPFLELIVDNATTGTTGAGSYKIGLKPGVRFPLHNGGDLTLLNLSSTVSHNVITQVIVEELIP